jgi:hypothetical protein
MALAGLPVAATLVSFTSEVVKADGHPEVLPRVHATTLIVGTVFMVALLPFHLNGVVVGFSIGWMAGALYGLRSTGRLLEIPPAEIWREIVPPAVAALVMAAILTPLEFLVVQADTRGTAVGLALVGAEALLGAIIYLAALSVLSRGTLHDLRDVAGRMLRRGRSAADQADPGSGVAVPETAMKGTQ